MMAKEMINPPVELLKEIFTYNPVTGMFLWNTRKPHLFSDGINKTASQLCNQWNKTNAGKEAFTSLAYYGYKRARTLGYYLSAHRVAWSIIHGDVGDLEIDHINGVTGDNRIENLRVATHGQNQWNHRRRSDNTSGYKGVSFNKRYGNYEAYIRKDGKRISLGRHDTAKAAHEAYVNAADILFGEFSNHG